jgi:PAS domain S-box-containing protein
VLFREPSTDDPIGQFVPDDPILMAARLKPVGTLHHQLVSTHASTITAYQTLLVPPLVVAVSLSEAELLAEWRRDVFGSILAFGVFTLFVVGAGVALSRQIDARVIAERALSEAEKRTRFALDAVRVGTWEVDLTSGTVEWSETLQTLHGLSPGTFGGTLEAFVDLIHPDDRADVQRTIEQATRDHTDANLVYRASWPDGTIHWMNGVGRTFYSEDGVPVRVVGVCMDITDRYVLEAQFRQAQKMEAIGQLAGGVAHDFNNLLTAIRGFAELLADRYQPGDPALDDLAEIRKAAERATALTRQLLAFGRRQILQPTALDLNAVLTDAVQMLRRLIAEDIDLRLRLSPDLRRVIADPIQLEQVLMNLVVNARDAMPDGGTLTIETTNVLLDASYARRQGITAAVTGPYALLQVTDSGIGMDSETQKRIFEPFFTTKSPGKGTGLGLATVYGIIKQSGGFVWVYSEVGAGTTFKVYWPSIEAPGHERTEPSAISDTSPRGTETVLLVEDEESVRRLGRTLLERCGYRVLQAPDAATAETMAASEAGPIDLLLTDVVMPGASGPELFSRLSRVRPQMKVLYMSGYADDAIVHRGVLDPGVAFLQKPFSALTLTRKVREVLDSLD